MSTELKTGQVVQVNVGGKYDGQRCFMTFHYYITGPVSATIPQDLSRLLDSFETNVWGATAGTKLNHAIHVNAVDIVLTGQVIVGEGSRSLLEIKNPTVATGGYNVATSLPSGNSIVLKRTGSRAGRKYRGRIYTFAVPNDYVSQSSIEPGAIPTLQTAANTLATRLTLGITPDLYTATPCLITGLAPPAAGQFIETGSVNTELRYQRRREVGVGI